MRLWSGEIKVKKGTHTQAALGAWKTLVTFATMQRLYSHQYQATTMLLSAMCQTPLLPQDCIQLSGYAAVG